MMRYCGLKFNYECVRECCSIISDIFDKEVSAWRQEFLVNFVKSNFIGDFFMVNSVRDSFDRNFALKV